VIVLDQFPRGLFADTPEAYSSDPDTLRVVEEGFRNGHYDALTSLWERFFYVLPLAHVEGPDHLERMRRIVAISERVAAEAPAPLQPIWEFSLSQAQANLEVIARFGRFPHRNPILGRVSTPEEAAYLEKGDFVHKRVLPVRSQSMASLLGLGRRVGTCRDRRSDGSRVQDASNLHSYGVNPLGRAIKRVAVDVEANGSMSIAR
jgi:uncharacterized protein (DUF924 family)